MKQVLITPDLLRAMVEEGRGPEVCSLLHNTVLQFLVQPGWPLDELIAGMVADGHTGSGVRFMEAVRALIEAHAVVTEQIEESARAVLESSECPCETCRANRATSANVYRN